MTDTTTTAPAKPAPKARTTKAKTAAAGVAFPDFEAFAMPKMEVPAMFREATEKGIENAREAYAKVKNAAEDATDLMEDTFETSRQGVVEFNHKAVDAAKANADATFTFVKDIMSAKSLAEAIELQSTFARQQFDALSAQSKEMHELATKLGTDVSAPVKEAFEKSFKDIKVN
ncbi:MULTISPECIES: phasin [Stappiaceae]|jgi:phasin|uniref:Phasin n=2 Tax=Roseibium TaxID=150830 RepID=A0A0M6Y518_9HYPH|nr:MULTISPECIES: phasin [Stappiaceae]MCR9281654.1 phasin [Paracoccaceae bacterium]MEC9400933.1 phasin [Pseudomonadota bacterium]AMN54898.1 phasin family protein [Labrenzia sp. CP4]AQQ03398.1 phasin [Roseibium aggregatum]ERP88774.1 phasin [Labrenzia sp. C1B10]